jgi:hypothetical protein
MRIHLLVCVLAGALSSPVVFGQQEQGEHAAHHPDPQAQEEDTAAADEGQEKMQAMTQNMKRIKALMQKIHAASDSAEKDGLMREHLAAMRKQMQIVLSMHPGMDMKGTMGEMSHGDSDARAASAKKDPKGGGMMGGGMMMKMHKQMEGRMRMLEMMLEQTIEREAVEAGVEHEN